ncbi:MAG: BLUF domain-containing protein [Rhizobiales bacterium]|nr:BLUF domain-containing protein [Hyphomicrobiales bacterium]
MLVRCLYASRAREPIGEPLVGEILEEARRNNPRHGITGLLCFSGDVFIQVLEGGRDGVCDMFNAIVRDERHGSVRILLFEEITARRFGDWTMGRANIAGAGRSVLLKYSETPDLNPFVGSGAATMALVNELLESGAISSRCR